MKKALDTLEFSEQEQKDMFNIISAILHLGNITFMEEEGHSTILKPDLVENVSKVLNYIKYIKTLYLFILFLKLLSCDIETLKNSLIQRTIETIRDVVTTPLDRELSIYARDALAKAIYDRLFTWLVTRINSSLQPENTRRNDVMGILDIYGFEIFEKNR